MTSGKQDGTSGASREWDPREIRWTAFAVVLLLIAAQAIANAYSRHADLADTDHPVALWQTGIEEASSGIAWTVCLVAIWHLVAHVRPPRFDWPATLTLHALATVPVSLIHVVLMIALREPAFALAGTAYDFAGDLPGALIYEYRKDTLSYVLLAAFSAGVQWFARERSDPDSAPESGARVLSVSDGAATHRIPLA